MNIPENLVEATAKALQQDWYIPEQREGKPPKWIYRQARIALAAAFAALPDCEEVEEAAAESLMASSLLDNCWGRYDEEYKAYHPVDVKSISRSCFAVLAQMVQP